MSTAITHAYHYVNDSGLVNDTRGKQNLQLATSGGAQHSTATDEDVPADHPFFFQGALTEPRVTAQALCVLSNVVASQFTPNPNDLKDPVVTSGGGLLRFEGFSGCCGVYGRVDLGPDGYDGLVSAHGTTNVDFNAPMRSALARIREKEPVSLAVGNDEVSLIRGADQVVERKVKLPVRWLKGFVEVQAYQSEMISKIELDRLASVRFLRSIPAGIRGRSEVWMVPTANALRVSRTKSAGGVPVRGLERLRLLEPLAPLAKGMRLYVDTNAGETSAWEIDLGSQSFTLLLSPDNNRGFSGEGQVLSDLARNRSEPLLDQARASLKWQAELRPEEFSENWDVPVEDVRGVLGLLGSRGLVGYDLSLNAYFHRVMPFDMSAVESMHPRLKNARALFAKADAIRIAERSGDGKISVDVDGSSVTHRVILDGDEQARCTCHWFTKHRGARGPCKHVLAARMFVEKDGARG